jgi:phage shock protein A
MMNSFFRNFTTKKMMYWVMGEKAGRTLAGTWNWLWGIPLEQGGKLTEKIAREALASMQESVLELTQAVAKVMAAHRQAKAIYEKKQQECCDAEHQALLATRDGNTEAARLAIARAIKIEEVLPSLKARVEKAENLFKSSKDKLRLEQERLEALKLDMENMAALTDVNQALAAINGLQHDFDLNSAKDQFSDAKTAIERRHSEMDAMTELMESPTEQLNAEMGRLVLDDEITRRLKRLTEG